MKKKQVADGPKQRFAVPVQAVLVVDAVNEIQAQAEALDWLAALHTALAGDSQGEVRYPKASPASIQPRIEE